MKYVLIIFMYAGYLTAGDKTVAITNVNDFLEAIKNDYKAITAVVKEDNLVSIRVLIKNGFIQIPFEKAGYKIYLRML